MHYSNLVLLHPSWRALPASWSVLRSLLYIILYMFVHTTMLKYMLYWKYMNWRRTSNRNTSSSWSVYKTHEYCNMNKLYKVPDAACIPNIN